MHEYYRKSIPKLKKTMDGYLKLIDKELEKAAGKSYDQLLQEIWDCYEKELLEHFPYIGGDKVSGTGNLTGAYMFVAMGEVLKRYGVSLEEAGRLMVICYEQKFRSMPGIARKIAGKVFSNGRLLRIMYKKKDKTNAENARKYPGSFETKTLDPPEVGYVFSYHNLVCPLADFAKKHGYDAYMPYLCNLDYAMFGALGVPLYREHTCAEDGDYCDFNLKPGAPVMKAWPPVFKQGKGYK